MTMKIKSCEIRSIARSKITLNPFNPKVHSEEKVKAQLRNMKKRGYLGGIVWNEYTGNLIDGHKRVLAYDLVYKYDGSPEKDYTIDVAVCQLDEKEEKEQMTYMAIDYTKADYSLIANYIGDIDYKEAGLSQSDLDTINNLGETDTSPVDIDDLGVELFNDSILSSEPKEAKEDIKAKKEAYNARVAEEYSKQDAYVTLSFTDSDSKNIFCEMFGYDMEAKIIKGEEFLQRIS